MAPTSNPTEALSELLASLVSSGAEALATDIRVEVARGKLQQLDVPKGRREEEARRPYRPEEAYFLAVQMILAALDPALMFHDIRTSIADIAHAPVEIVWRADYLEGTAEDQRALVESIDPLAPLADVAADELHKAAVRVADAVASVSRKE